MRTTTATLGLLALLATPLLAQGRRRPAANRDSVNIANAVATITPDDYHRRIAIIADDSMRGRGTPSPELEETARWIAGEFQRFGLRPGGDSGGYLQRYHIRRTLIDTTSFVMAMGHGAHGHWIVGRDALYLGGDLTDSSVSGPVVLVYGTPADTAHPFGNVNLSGAVILQISAGAGGRLRGIGGGPMVAKAAAAGAKAWISVAPLPANFWNAQIANAHTPRLQLIGGFGGGRGGAPIPTFLIRDSSAMGVLSAAGENLDSLRLPNATGVRALQGFTGAMSAKRINLPDATAPNVIGILEGSDPVLKNEYVFFTGHMDHVGVAGMGNGCTAVGGDSICNGADDDASGTTGVVMLAQAFSQMHPRPRRSLVFMTVSGEERGLWGSDYYTSNPTLPMANTVADLNTDMIGRYYNNQSGWRDTVVAIGKEHSSLGASANKVVQEHPELHMNMIDDIWPEQNFYSRSDHFNFARKGVPILFFFNGTHPDYHRPSDSVDKIDSEKASRIVKLVFYLGLDVANTTERPQWNPESRARIVAPATN
ncbi:MAG TPA: M28 family peptidase [Gemmatimonadales bacterium]